MEYTLPDVRPKGVRDTSAKVGRMGIFDWLIGSGSQGQESGMSRRDFFARFAGRGADDAPAAAPPRDPRVLHSFHVAGFPFYDGPVLVPVLRVGMEFDLVPEPGHPTDPDAIRIQWKRDHLGYVPPDLSAEVRKLLKEGPAMRCRAGRISPNAELAKVLEVDLVKEGDSGTGDKDPDG